jgi:hypothetical protein
MSTNRTYPGDEPFRSQAPRFANAVVLALVVAIFDLERRRVRGKVVTPMPRTRSA